LVARIEGDFHHKKGSLLTFWAKQTSSADIKNPQNVPVKIPQNSVSQSDEQVIGAEADDSEPSTGNLATFAVLIRR
jgi:hypothetical protein